MNPHQLKTMKKNSCSIFIVGLIFLQSLCLTVAQDNANYQPGLLTGLTLDECVHVINGKTLLRVNLELLNEKSKARYVLNLREINSNSPPTIIESILKQDDNYVLLRSNDVFNIVPKQRQNDRGYVLNQIVDDFSTTNDDLVTTFQSLTKLPPQLISIYRPFSSYKGKPDPESMPKWEREAEGGKMMSLHLEQTTFRKILNEVAAQQGKTYWIATPRESLNPNLMGIWLYSLNKQDFASPIVVEHDPILKARVQKFDDEQDRIYLEKQARLQSNTTDTPVPK